MSFWRRKPLEVQIEPEHVGEEEQFKKGPYRTSEKQTIERVDLNKAREIFGKDFLGSEAVERTFGIKLNVEEIPEIPFSQKELERAKEFDQFLVFRVDRAPDGKPLTMEKLNELLEDKFRREGKGKIMRSKEKGMYRKNTFFINEVPELQWALVSKDIISGSTSKNYLDQTRILAQYLQEKEKENDLSLEYQGAVLEFQNYLRDNFREKSPQEIFSLISGEKRSVYGKELPELSINKLMRHRAVEALYDLLLYFDINNKRLLEDNKHIWTGSCSDKGKPVYVGNFCKDDGIFVFSWVPAANSSDLGIFISRTKSIEGQYK